MNQYRATQLLEGKEIKQDELGLNALVGFATGNWGEAQSAQKDIIRESFRIMLGQAPWDKIKKSFLQEQTNPTSLGVNKLFNTEEMGEDEK